MIIPVDFAQVNFIFTGAAQPRTAQVVVGVDNSGSSLGASAICTLAANAWTDNILPVQSEGLTLFEVKAKLGPNSTGAEARIAWGSVGGDDSQPVPPQVTMLVSKVTNLGGRKHKGRMNLPGLTEDDTPGGGTWADATMVAAQSAVNGFFDDMLAADLPLYLLHTDATAPDQILELRVEKRAATQRRRIRRVGGRRSAP